MLFIKPRRRKEKGVRKVGERRWERREDRKVGRVVEGERGLGSIVVWFAGGDGIMASSDGLGRGIRD